MRTEPAARLPRWAVGVAALGFGLLVLAVGVSQFGDEPVRRMIEQRMNEHLRGHRIEIGRVDLRPLGFGMDVLDLVVVRIDHPDPPLAHLTEISASIDWRALLHGAVVADISLHRPIVYVDRTQVEREMQDEITLEERGWQEAVEAVSPIEINQVRVTDGEATYVDEGPFPPLRLTGIQARAANIRNIRSADREYPSGLSLDARVFEAGWLEVRGHADFLARPAPGISATVELAGVALETFQPILQRHHFAVREGTLSLSGELEVGRTLRTVHLREVMVKDFVGDYLRTPASAAKEPALVHEAVSVAKRGTERPELTLRADRIMLRNANVGVVNRTADPHYRVFLSHTDLDLENLSNRFSEGPGRARLRGRFMGSGVTDAKASFQPERSGPEFDLEVRIVDTELRAANDLLRAHGKFDVSAGFFSVYSEVHVENGRVDGYVKPLFRDVQVGDPRAEPRKGVARRAYESVVGGVAGLLENKARDEVATQSDLSGPLGNPETGTFELLAKLVENAFFQSILPGFDREVAGRGPAG